MAEKKFSVIVSDIDGAHGTVAVILDTPGVWLSYPAEMIFRQFWVAAKELAQGLVDADVGKYVTLREEDADLAGGSEQ